MKSIIQIFSPHFDDAVLSCGEHILYWQHQGYEVLVTTVFNSFKAHVLSQDSIEFMQKGNSLSAQEFENVRSKEDYSAMQELNIKQFQSLGYVDAGFREQDSAPTYINHLELFDGHIKDNIKWQNTFISDLQKSILPKSRVIIPLGVGNHVDHILVKRAIEQSLVPNIYYYIDIPYAFSFSNWKPSYIKKCLYLSHSLLWSSEKKITAVNKYTSQVPILFPDKLWSYPEIILRDNKK